MGGAGESRMTAHQTKKLDMAALAAFRDRFELPLSDSDLEHLKFFKPAEDSAEMVYLRDRRAALGGFMPSRVGARSPRNCPPPPAREGFAKFALAAEGKRDVDHDGGCSHAWQSAQGQAIGPPHRAHRCRRGAHLRHGQSFSPDRNLCPERPALRAGGCRLNAVLRGGCGWPAAGGRHHARLARVSSWAAAATAYSVHDLPMLPFYIYYSMFGFQRVGDLIWAAADQRARGLSAWRDRGPHDACRAKGFSTRTGQPRDRCDHTELPRLRSGLCLRACNHHRSRDSPDDGGAGGRVFLHYGDERELCAADNALGQRRWHPEGTSTASVGAATTRRRFGRG